MKQIINYLIVIILWIVGFILAYTGKSAWLIIALITLHFLELITIGFRTGRKYGLGVLHSIAMCMLFGIVWWLPLRKTMEDDEYSDADFFEDGSEPWREAF